MNARLFLLIPVLILTGCYTLLYPPPEYFSYEQAIPDSLTDSSVVSGVNINIYNNIDNEYLGRYYQDSRYFRHYGWWDDYYWDPYYYNYDSYHHHHHWDRGRYRVGRGHWDGKHRKPIRKRRTNNLRREFNQSGSNNLPPTISNPSGKSANAIWKPLPPSLKEEEKKPEKRKVRSIEKESKEKESEKEKKDGKKSRRKDSPRR